MKCWFLLVFFVVYTNSFPYNGGPVIKHRTKRQVDILLMSTHVECEIENRYARTTVKHVYNNPNDEAEQTDFFASLPTGSFITDFRIEVDNKVYESQITSKEKAMEFYDALLDKGLTTSQTIHAKFRESEGVYVPINLQANKNVSVILKYDEVLTYYHAYYWNFNIFITDYVPEFSINVFISELAEIKNINVFHQTADDVTKKYPIDTNSVRISNQKNRAHINFEAPKSIGQDQTYIFYRSSENADINVQFILQYTLETKTPGGQVLIDENGYYVHSVIAPSRLVQPLPKHIIFALDTSYSMNYKKINQLKSAMNFMIDKLTRNDYLSIITYDSIVTVWNLETKRPSANTNRVYGRKVTGITDKTLNSLPKPYPATPNIVQNAKNLIFSLSAKGATNIYDSLKLAYHLGKSTKDLKNYPETIIVYLTDGWATVAERKSKAIMDMAKQMNMNQKKINLFTLGFGSDANKVFLNQIAKENHGSFQYIYEASDADKQMTNFYETLSQPILSDVKFNHPESYKDQSTNDRFSLLNQGQELISSGQVKKPLTLNDVDFNLQGNSIDGTKTLPPKVLRLYREVLADKLVDADFGKVEKYHAFIKLKELLKAENPNVKQIVDYSLKYKFVTPYTSLIAYVPPDDDSDDELKSIINTFEIDLRTNKMKLKSRFNEDSPIPTLPWLGSYLEENKIEIRGELYDIGGSDTKLESKDVVECDVPKIGESGNCTLFNDCPGVHAKLKNFETYVDYFCPLESNKYAGVCCILEDDDDE